MTRKQNPIDYDPGKAGSSGKDVTDTQMLKGEASLLAQQTMKNTVKPYTTSGSQPGKGTLGNG